MTRFESAQGPLLEKGPRSRCAPTRPVTLKTFTVAWAAFAALGGATGCKTGANELGGDAATSPQAKAEPAPLVSVPASSMGGVASGGLVGPAPEPLRMDEGLAPDLAREMGREPPGREVGREIRDIAGYTLQVSLRTGEGAGAPKAPEVNTAAIDGARRRAEAKMTIDLSATRARVVLNGGFVVPQGTELRARSDRYGHLLVWPGEPAYRVAQPGALRALLGERRLDVAPLSPADVRGAGEGLRRLNLRTRRVDVSTRAAKATLELGAIRDSGEGGSLVCRLLLDLMSATPSATACASDDVPLHAELHWTTRGALTFDVTSISRRTDLSPQDLATPPATLVFIDSPPPSEPADTLVPRAELLAFRTAAVDLPAVGRDGQAPPEAGLLLVNSSDELRVVWIDGVPAAWVGPGERLALPSMLRGRYSLQWRTFLGDAWEPPEILVVPGTSEVGGSRPAP